jgi:hypothetical protein
MAVYAKKGAEGITVVWSSTKIGVIGSVRELIVVVILEVLCY